MAVGVLGRAHGLRGELRARLHNPDSQLLTEGRRFRVGDGEAAQRTVARARWTAKGWLVLFEGVGHREAAAALTNCKLYVRRTELPEVDDDEVYLDDLVGMSVIDTDESRLGRIAGFFFNGAHDVCVVRTEADLEVLLPFHEGVIVDVRFDEQLVIVDVPDGIPGLDGEASSDGPR